MRLQLLCALPVAQTVSTSELWDQLTRTRQQAEHWHAEARRLQCQIDRRDSCDSTPVGSSVARVHASHSEVSANITAARKKLELWRKKAGRLSCVLNGVGPTGGFCMTKKSGAVGGNGCLPATLAPFLAHRWAGKNVLELGCGTGPWGRYLKEHAPTVHWVGLDGAEMIEEATGHFVQFADLSLGLPQFVFHRHWDVVMSIEVGEHVPRSGEASFMHNLVALRPQKVIVSWAVLGQGGHHHINCQTNAYVKCAMRLLGWRSDATMERRLRSLVHDFAWSRNATDPFTREEVMSISCPWLQHTVMAFDPELPDPAQGSSRATIPIPRAATLEFAREYERRTAAECGYVENGCERKV